MSDTWVSARSVFVDCVGSWRRESVAQPGAAKHFPVSGLAARLSNAECRQGRIFRYGLPALPKLPRVPRLNSSTSRLLRLDNTSPKHSEGLSASLAGASG